MIQNQPTADWPELWKSSYKYDLQEVYGQPTSLGYAYAYENRQRRTLELIEEVLQPGDSILDVAAAQGNFSLILAERGYRVTWNDLREELAGYVRLKHEKGELLFAPGNIFEIDFDELFDCVLITEIIEHVAHPDQFLATIASLVKPGGYIVMTTPNGAYFRNRLPRFSACRNPEVYEAVQFRPNSDGHIFLLWPDEVASLSVNTGLSLERLSLFTTPLTNGHIKLGKLLPVLPKSIVNLVERTFAAMPRQISSKFSVHMAVRFRKSSQRVELAGRQAPSESRCNTFTEQESNHS